MSRAGVRHRGIHALRHWFASATYTRDTPLDHETFRDPAAYLRRQTRPPKVRLDSRRIVQRHVNALLLARWFAAAGGEAQKTRAGEFFGCPELGGAERPANSPGRICMAWMASPTAWQDLHGDVEQLVAGTALAGDRTLFAEAARALELAETAIVSDWEALQAQIASAGKEEGRASLEYQLKRLARENLLKELVVRGLPPYSAATSAASESGPFLKSTGRVASITFVPSAGPIIAMPVGR